MNDTELADARQRWMNGGSALPLIELLAARGRRVEAATIAWLALAQPDCIDAAALEAVVASLVAAPGGWSDALAGFAGSPSLEGWRALMRFVPSEALYLRQRDAIARLRALGVDANMLFMCATELAMTPDAIELVEEGRVAVAQIVARAARARGAKATYFGLAAQAAFLEGDLLCTVRLLRQALTHENDLCPVQPHIAFIRERASPQQQELLDRAGIPAQ